MKKINQKVTQTFSIKSSDRKSGKASSAATLHTAFAIENILFDEDNFTELEKKINPKKTKGQTANNNSSTEPEQSFN
jgi:hypothetical protein